MRISRARADEGQTVRRLSDAAHTLLYSFSQKRNVSQIGPNGMCDAVKNVEVCNVPQRSYQATVSEPPYHHHVVHTGVGGTEE